MTANDVIAAINNEDPHDQLKIAYHLILDNRIIVETGISMHVIVMVHDMFTLI